MILCVSPACALQLSNTIHDSTEIRTPQIEEKTQTIYKKQNIIHKIIQKSKNIELYPKTKNNTNNTTNENKEINTQLNDEYNNCSVILTKLTKTQHHLTEEYQSIEIECQNTKNKIEDYELTSQNADELHALQLQYDSQISQKEARSSEINAINDRISILNKKKQQYKKTLTEISLLNKKNIYYSIKITKNQDKNILKSENNTSKLNEDISQLENSFNTLVTTEDLKLENNTNTNNNTNNTSSSSESPSLDICMTSVLCVGCGTGAVVGISTISAIIATKIMAINAIAAYNTAMYAKLTALSAFNSATESFTASAKAVIHVTNKLSSLTSQLSAFSGADASVVQSAITNSISSCEFAATLDYNAAITAQEALEATSVGVNSALASAESSMSIASFTVSVGVTVLVVVAVVVILCVIAYVGYKEGWWKRLGFY